MADRSYRKKAFSSEPIIINGLCFPCHKNGGGEMSELNSRYDN